MLYIIWKITPVPFQTQVLPLHELLDLQKYTNSNARKVATQNKVLMFEFFFSLDKVFNQKSFSLLFGVDNLYNCLILRAI